MATFSSLLTLKSDDGGSVKNAAISKFECYSANEITTAFISISLVSLASYYLHLTRNDLPLGEQGGICHIMCVLKYLPQPVGEIIIPYPAIIRPF